MKIIENHCQSLGESTFWAKRGRNGAPRAAIPLKPLVKRVYFYHFLAKWSESWKIGGNTRKCPGPIENHGNVGDLGKVPQMDECDPKLPKSKKSHAPGHAENLIKPCPFGNSVEILGNPWIPKKSSGIHRIP